MRAALSWPWRKFCELMTGEDGRLSFGKAMLVAVFWVYATKTPMPVTIAIVLILAAHGIKYLTAWLESRPFTATEAVSAKLEMIHDTITNKTIVERRDPVDGVEPTP